MLPEAQRDLDQRRIVGAHVAEPDEVGDHAVHEVHEVVRLVAPGAEAALPQIDEERVVVVGPLLGAQLGLRARRLLLGLARDRVGGVARRLGLAPFLLGLHLGLDLGAQGLHGRERLLHLLGGGIARRARRGRLLEQRLAALGDVGDMPAVVVEHLHGAALAGIEIVDQPACRHLVELHARQLAQRLGALLAQALGLAHRRAQRSVELGLLPV